MASIPLPALGVNPPQPQNPAEQMGKLVQMKSMMQQQQLQSGQLQLQQQQLKDQHATTQAMLGWDGKNFSDLSKSVLTNGGSANAAMAVTQHGMQIQETASKIAQQDAETGSKNLQTIIDKHNQILGALDAAKQVPDEQLIPHLQDTVKSLTQSGMMDPQSAQQANQLLQQNLPPISCVSNLLSWKKP